MINWLYERGGKPLMTSERILGSKLMLMKDYPPKLDIVLARALLRLFVATFSRRQARETFSREPKTFALIFSVELDRKLLPEPTVDRIFSFELDKLPMSLAPIFSFELELNWLLDPGLELLPRFSFELDLRSINSIIGFDLKAELIDLVISDCLLADVDRTEDLKVHWLQNLIFDETYLE